MLALRFLRLFGIGRRGQCARPVADPSRLRAYDACVTPLERGPEATRRPAPFDPILDAMTPTPLATAQRARAQQIRARSHGGHDLLDLLEAVAHGEPLPYPNGESRRPTPALQRKAAARLQAWRRHELLDLVHDGEALRALLDEMRPTATAP